MAKKNFRERDLPVAKSCQVEEPYQEEEGPSQEDIDYYYCCTVLPAAAALGAAEVDPTWSKCLRLWCEDVRRERAEHV